MATLTSIFKSFDGEQRWIDQVSKILQNDEVMVSIDLPVSIFRVPTNISVFKPEAYVPQLIGLGPYHHFHSELYEMERYKLAAADRFKKQIKSLEFKKLVDKLIELEYKVRACYHKYLDIEAETLAWFMAIDSLFLLEFLRTFLINMNANTSSSSCPRVHLVNSSGKKLTHSAVLGEIMMLENQISIFILRDISSIQCSFPDVEDNSLPSMLLGFCKSISPLKLVNEDHPLSQVSQHAHLLDLLYHLTVPKFEGSHSDDQPGNSYGKMGSSSFGISSPSFDSSKSRQVLDKLWNLLSNLNVGFISKITKFVDPVLNLLSILTSTNKEEDKPEGDNSSDDKKTPVVEETTIPSVSKLSFAGVEFCPTIDDMATGPVMRNLVAYEASTTSESLVFARYTELMNGIIDTAEVAKLLREKKIIVNRLKSNADVAELFNRMSKSVRLTNVPNIDKAIKDVNIYFHNAQRIRMYKLIKNFVYGSWQILTIIAVLLFMFLTAIRSFCSVYNCPHSFNKVNSSSSR